MDEFAQLPPGERRLYFEEAAALQGITPQLIEKDFWVCWMLRKLFALDPVGEKLTFKGGTSLSKVFGLIERFSEDIDVAIEREFLGFTGDNDPLQDLSQKKRDKLLDCLTESSEILIADVLAPRLRASIEEALPDSGWSLDLSDEDKQTLLFRYPQSISSQVSAYFPSLVKVELGARSDHYPVGTGTIKPYVAEMLPSVIDDSGTHVRVLSAARTFWEKATILHSMHHHRKGFPIRRGQSRHLYDVFRIANSSVIEDALQQITLLQRTSIHAMVFFRRPWAHLDTARPGTLRLLPRDEIIDDLRQDYAAMQPMFFTEPPAFDIILNRLPEIENRINAASQE